MILSRKIFLGLTTILILINFLVWQEVFALSGLRYLKMNVLDIGQGDSIFIETPANHQILVDGGPGSVVLGRLPEYMPIWDRSLDMVVLTHPDLDHMSGLLAVLQKYKVDYILWTGTKRDSAAYQKWVKLVDLAQKRGTKIIIAKKGQRIFLGNATVQVLNPQENLEGVNFKNTSNDTSIVLRLTIGEKSFLLTGDMTEKAEKKIMETGVDLDSDVLKVAHHGSKYSTSEEFLQAVTPEIAAISVQKSNSYGHPTPEVLQRLQKFGITILRTDELGNIEILSDGRMIKVVK